MEFSVQITFREQWNDERLRFDGSEGMYVVHIFKMKKKKRKKDTILQTWAGYLRVALG